MEEHWAHNILTDSKEQISPRKQLTTIEKEAEDSLLYAEKYAGEGKEYSRTSNVFFRSN